MNFLKSFIFILLALSGVLKPQSSHAQGLTGVYSEYGIESDYLIPQTAAFDAQSERQQIVSQNFSKWNWLESSCSHCNIRFWSADTRFHDQRVQRFMKTLESSKFEILKIYNCNEQEYNLLAFMAIGILGKESRFFNDNIYVLKEQFPWAVTMGKIFAQIVQQKKTISPNSRGPTQIKKVPGKIAEAYGITTDTLYIPENAALATVGFLIESLHELKAKAQHYNLEYIQPSNYIDYLPYIYFGQSARLIDRTATPEKNKYVQKMKSYLSLVEVFEKK